jgi:hypothetical protein
LPVISEFIRRCALNFRPHDEVIAAMGSSAARNKESAGHLAAAH